MQDEPSQQPEFVGSVSVVSGQIVSSETTALTNNIARLEERLDTEREDRLEERFRWVCAMSILFDVLAMVAVNGSWLFVLIFMLQLKHFAFDVNRFGDFFGDVGVIHFL